MPASRFQDSRLVRLSEQQFREWLTSYFQAWKTNDASHVAPLFAENAVYHYGPFRAPAIGKQQIVENWISDPAGQTDIAADFEVIATSGNVGVCHWNVTFKTESDPASTTELDGILVVEFNSAGECVEHREWYSQRRNS